MNLIEESFQNKQEKKKKRATKIILGAIVFVFIVIVAIAGYLMYIQSTTMRLTIDGQQASEKVKNLFVFEQDGTIYVPIKEIATYLGYESFNGEYSAKSEQQSKCYVQNTNEIANFELGENKIYKLDLTKSDADYEYVYIKKPVKAINGVLYVTTEGLEKAFNVSFEYEQEKNRMTIFTLPYLYQYYATKVLDYGYIELNKEFVNQKAILNQQLIVLKDKDKKQYGVITLDGSAILEPKYDNITYLVNTGDFLVETNKKVGIMSASRDTKVDIIYDRIELMDSDSGLYVAKIDNKYGVIDIRGNIKIYIENDEIGVDLSRFSQNNIKNKYLLVDNLIPVRKDKYWAFYDKSGNQLTEYKYDSLGYIASNNREALNLLVIPNYNVMVACKNKKYTLVNSSGEELFATIADDIYMTISGGETHYYIIANEQKINAVEWLDSNGVTSKSNHTNQNNNQDNQNNQNNNNNKNETSENNANEQQNHDENQDDENQQNNNGDSNEEEENQNNNQEENNDNNENNNYEEENQENEDSQEQG